MEIWKDIKDYEGTYKISNLGRIKSLKYGKERILIPIRNKSGYLYIHLSKENNHKMYRIHRLVCLAFLDNPENKKEVNHINGIKADNRLENLEWCTSSENEIHSYKILGKKYNFQTNLLNKGKFGKDSISSKKVNQYNLYGEFIKSWDAIMDIQRELGINQSNISLCCKGKRKTAGLYIWKYKED